MKGSFRSRRPERDTMVQWQVAGRGVRDEHVLRAMREVPREAFVPAGMLEFAYDDSALPIAESQTISQPYIVAVMLEALQLTAVDRVLDVGTGSGYSAAVASRIASEVFTIERHASLARTAQETFRVLGYDNIHVRVGDGSLGWPEAQPFDAIAVAAAGPSVPPALIEQLRENGRLVIPTGSARLQRLVRITRTASGLVEDDLGDVRFVPLIGAGAWPADEAPQPQEKRRWRRAPTPERDRPSPPAGAGTPTAVHGRIPPRAAGAGLAGRLRGSVEPLPSLEQSELGPLLGRIGECPVVLLGEASHGTSEFYRMRARITRELIETKGFRALAIEADWPDAARLDAWVRNYPPLQPELSPFSRFPTWMWRNEEFYALMVWLRSHNQSRLPDERVGVYGLDLYSLYASLDAVLRYLDDVDPEAAASARVRYGCLTPWSGDPASYGRAAIAGRYKECEEDVVRALTDLLAKRIELEARGERRFFEAERNAHLVANAERYYRAMYYGSRTSWNLRDQHMFDTLLAVLEHAGGGRAVVWAHNSHLGDASATEMGARGEHNVGQLARERFGAGAYLIGFGTHGGTVAAASDWGEPMQVMRLEPSHERSYEHLCHSSEVSSFFLPLRTPRDAELSRELARARLERAIGVVYRPESELESHYFHASLPAQFDEYVWFDETEALRPLSAAPGRGPAETFPFGV